MSDQTARIRATEQVLFREVGGEAVILHVSSGAYYALDPVGARMWALILQHGQLEPVCEALLKEFDVSPSQLRHDLAQLIDDLVSHGLVCVDPAES